MRRQRRGWPVVLVAALAGAALAGAALAGAALAAAAWSCPAAGAATGASKAGPQPSPPPIGELPVVSCPTSYGAGESPRPFVARELPTTSTVRGLDFYSNGLLTVLGPAGWACGALVAADGGQKIDVFPPGQPDDATRLAPRGTELVEVVGDYTGHVPGAEVVCALFPSSPAASEVAQSGLPCRVSASQKTVRLTPDVVTFADAPHVTGSGAGSGGTLASTGAAVYPQLASGSADSVDVALLSCTLPKSEATLCRAVLGDFLVRNPPAYVPRTSG